ncbi:MAG TPA: peptidylprolyl isomerase [Dehalococcoidales bacterium]|nr:peptidylprolyl isomerase [Dehalococcoidales bacterium]
MKKKLFIFTILIGLILTAVLVTGCGPKTAQTGDKVKVNYELRLPDGTVVDSTAGGSPFEFTIGNNQVIKGFEKAVIGMKVGEKKTVSIQPKDGYGDYDPTLTQVIQATSLPTTITPTVGMPLSGYDTSGNPFTVLIKSINNDGTITLDTNSPLAGKVLTFDITLVEIEKK